MPENTYPLKQISPKAVDFNDSNPRDESEEEILSDESFELLKTSVFRYGVLVPIVVHQQAIPGKPYKLVDGERRLRAALATGREQIPAHIAVRKSNLDEMLQAVHIHMLRKQWKPIARARAIKKIVKDYKAEHPDASEKDLANELRSLTGCSENELKSLRRAAKYPEKVLDDVDKGGLKFSHLVQFEESFVEQLESNYPELLKRESRKKVRSVLVNKAKSKVLTSTRALMENVLPVVGRAKEEKQKRYVETLLNDFINNENMPAEDILGQYNNMFPVNQQDILRLAEEIIEMATELSKKIRELNIHEVKSLTSIKNKLFGALTSLKSSITRKIK